MAMPKQILFNDGAAMRPKWLREPPSGMPARVGELKFWPPLPCRD